MILLERGPRVSPLATWKTEVQCGEHTKGCGAKLQIQFNDVFKHGIESLFGSSTSYRTKCPCCHEDVMIPHEGVPFSPDEVMSRTTWLKFKRNALLMQLAEETPEDRYSELYESLVEDGIECPLLNQLFIKELAEK
jgi:hypothetical protein